MQHVKHVNYKFPQVGGIYPESQRSFIVLGPSGVGKTSAMISLLTGPMKGLHTRIWTVSPIGQEGHGFPLGQLSQVVGEAHGLGRQGDDLRPLRRRTLGRAGGDARSDQRRADKAGRKQLHSACLLIDDLADSPEFHNNRDLIAKICL